MSDEFNLEDELVRKAGESLMWLDNEFKRGRINKDQFATAQTVFDMVTMGLIPMEWNDWAVQQRVANIAAQALPERTVLFAPKTCTTIVVTLDRVVGSITVVQMNSKGKSERTYGFEDEADTIKAASDKYPDLVQKIISRNYQVIK